MSKLANQAQTINKLIPEANVLRRIAKADGSISFNYAAKTLQLLPLCGGSLQIGQEGFDPQHPDLESGGQPDRKTTLRLEPDLGTENEF